MGSIGEVFQLTGLLLAVFLAGMIVLIGSGIFFVCLFNVACWIVSDSVETEEEEDEEDLDLHP